MFVSWGGSPWGGLPMGSRQPSGRFPPNFYDIVPHMRWWCAESGEWNKSKLTKFFFLSFSWASKHGEAISTTSRSIPPKLLSYSAPYEVTATQKFGAKKVKIEEVFFFSFSWEMPREISSPQPLKQTCPNLCGKVACTLGLYYESLDEILAKLEKFFFVIFSWASLPMGRPPQGISTTVEPIPSKLLG